MTNIKKAILKGIPRKLPNKRSIDINISHAPKRKDILQKKEMEKFSTLAMKIILLVRLLILFSEPYKIRSR